MLWWQKIVFYIKLIYIKKIIVLAVRFPVRSECYSSPALLSTSPQKCIVPILFDYFWASSRGAAQLHCLGHPAFLWAYWRWRLGKDPWCADWIGWDASSSHATSLQHASSSLQTSSGRSGSTCSQKKAAPILHPSTTRDPICPAPHSPSPQISTATSCNYCWSRSELCTCYFFWG